MDEKELKLLWESLSKSIDIGEYDYFKSAMLDSNRRKKFYDLFTTEPEGKKYIETVNPKFVDYNGFNTYIDNLKKKEPTVSIPPSEVKQPVSGVPSVATSQLKYQYQLPTVDPTKSAEDNLQALGEASSKEAQNIYTQSQAKVKSLTNEYNSYVAKLNKDVSEGLLNKEQAQNLLGSKKVKIDKDIEGITTSYKSAIEDLQGKTTQEKSKILNPKQRKTVLVFPEQIASEETNNLLNEVYTLNSQLSDLPQADKSRDQIFQKLKEKKAQLSEIMGLPESDIDKATSREIYSLYVKQYPSATEIVETIEGLKKYPSITQNSQERYRIANLLADNLVDYYEKHPSEASRKFSQTYTDQPDALNMRRPSKYDFELEKFMIDTGKEAMRNARGFIVVPENARPVDVNSLKEVYKRNLNGIAQDEAVRVMRITPVKGDKEELAAGLMTKEQYDAKHKYENIIQNIQNQIGFARKYASNSEDEKQIEDYFKKGFSWIADVGNGWRAKENRDKNPQYNELNEYQKIYLEHLRATDPEKYKNRLRLLTTPKELVKDYTGEYNPRLEIGYQNLMKEAEDQGVLMAELNYIHLIEGLSKKKDSVGLTAQDKLDFAELMSGYEELQKFKNSQIDRYPVATSREIMYNIGRATGDVPLSRAGRLGMGTIYEIGGAVDWIYEAITAPFTGKDSRISDLEKMGSDDFVQSEMNRGWEDAGVVQGMYKYIIEPEFKKQIDAIESDDSLADYEKYDAKVNAFLNYRKEKGEPPIGIVKNPDAGDINLSAAAILNTTADIGQQIAAQVALAYLSGGLGNVSKVRSLATLFGTTFATTINKYEVEALKEGRNDVTEYAIRNATIDALTELIGNDLGQVKRLFKGKGAVGKIVDSITESEWKKVLSAKKNVFGKLKSVVGQIPKTILKPALTETVEESLGEGFKNALDGKDIFQNQKETIATTFIGTLGAFGAGLPFVYRNVSNSQKVNLYNAGVNAEEYLSSIKSQLDNGEIDAKEAEKRTQIIQDIKGIVDKMPRINENGRPLSDGKLIDLAFNKYVELQTQRAKKENPKSEKLNEVIDELQNDNARILSGAVEEVKPGEVAPEVPATTEVKAEEVKPGEEVVEAVKPTEVTPEVPAKAEVKPEEVKAGEVVTEAKPAVPTAKIENPTVVITGTRKGLESLESNNYDPKVDPKIQDARGREFKDNVLIDTDEKGNQIINVKVEALDAFGRQGFLQASVVVPEGVKVDSARIKSVVDAEVQRIKDKYKSGVLELDKVEPSDFTGLKDAVVAEVKGAGEVAPEGKAEVPAAPTAEAKEIEQLRAAEQAEYAAMPDPNDQEKRQEIYDKYDKLITPLLEKEKTATGAQKFGVGFAPFREKNVFTEEEDVDIRNSPDYKLHQENVQKIAEGLGIKINNKLDTWGGYVDMETGRPVQEVSNIMEIEATPEQARLMAAILGKAAPEMQDSVLLGNYNENGIGFEHIVKTGSFENGKEAIKLLKDNGLQYFSVDKKTGDVIILDLKAEDTPKIVNLVKQLNENGIPAKHKYGKINAEFVESGSYDGIIEAERGRVRTEKGFDIDAFVKEAARKYDAIKAEAKPIVSEVQKSMADKIRGLKIDLSKLGGGGAQSNIAGLPVALYNTVVEAVALAVQAGVSINKAIKDAILKYNLDKQKGFNKFELVNSIAKTLGSDLSKSVSDIDVDEIRTKSRPGKRVSKGLAIYTKDKKKVIEEAEELSLDYVKQNAPDIFISNANIIANYPIVKGVKEFGEITTLEEAQEVYDIFIKQISDNLKYLMSEYKLEFRDIATLWYDGANIIAQEFSNKYGISEEQAAGIIASLSPQKDWYQNVRLAEMVMMAFDKNPSFTNEMINKQKAIIKEGEKPKLKAIKKAEEAYKKNKTKANAEKVLAKKKAHEKFMKKANSILSMLQLYEGKKLNQVPNYVKPYIVRLSNEINTTKDYNILSPDGKTIGLAMKKDGKTKSKVAWGSYTEIGKAVSIYLDGSQENITRTLGEMHKIRNFYNNIIDPMSKDNDVTMDTHAVAAALLLPLSGNSKEVGQNFGTGTSNSGPLGIKGLYYAFAEGYKKAAEESGLLPRQVQSITWEAVRGLFTDTFKRNKTEVAKIKDIWNNYVNGKIDINETRKQITESAGGINDPSWAKSIAGGRGPVQAEFGEGVEAGGIKGGARVSGRVDVGAGPGDGGGKRGARASVEKAAKTVRSLKIKQQGLQSNIAGIPIALYNAALETIATALEAGASLKEAIDRAIEKHKLNKQKGFNAEEFIQPLEDASGQTYPKVGGKYAVQEQAAGEIPVQPKAGVSKEVEGGVPGAKPEEVAKEAKAEGEEREMMTGVEPGQMVGIKHEATEKMRTSYALPEYERPESKTMAELEAEADAKIKEGYDIGALVKKLENGNAPSGVENVILAKYLGVLNAEFEKTKSKETLAKIERVANAIDTIGTIQSESFRTRKIMKPKEDTLAQYFIEEKADAGVEELTPQQEATITKEYEEIKAATEALQKKVDELQKENARLLAEGNIEKYKKEKPKTKKTDEDFKQERKQIVSNIKDKLKKARSQASVSVVPYANELFAISPDIAKLVKSYVEQGVTKLADIVDGIHASLKEDITDITKKDVQDLIAGEYREKKKTRNEIAAQVRDLKTEAKLLNDYEKIEKGEVPKTEKRIIERNRRLTELKNQIRESDVSKLAEAKEKLRTRIAKLEKQLAEGDFEKAPEKETIKLDKEGRELQKQLIKLRRARDVRRLNVRYEKQNKVKKAFNKILKVFDVPRSLVASTDFSAPFTQAGIATMVYPKEAKEAFTKMFKSAASEESLNNWFYELQESPRYELIKKTRLAINDPDNPDLSEKELDVVNGYATQIPVIGKFVKGSERAQVQYLNKLRVDIFNKLVDRFESQGKTYENNKRLYDVTAKYVNNITGRGELGPLKAFAPLFRQLFFSPYFVAAHINMLNPYYFATLPKELKLQYGKDMGSFVAVLGTLLSMAAIYGSTQKDDDEDKITVETDPRSSDFAKIKQGNTRYDFTGGYSQYLRLGSQLAPSFIGGGKRKTAKGEFIELDGKAPGTGRNDVVLSFFRNKLAPVPAMVVDFSTGKNAIGEKVKPGEEIIKNLVPLSLQSIYEGYKEQGVKSLFTVALPSIFGVGVSTYKPKGKQVSNKIFKEGGEIKLNDEQRDEYQKLYDERKKINLEKLKSLEEYKTSPKDLQVQLEQIVETKSLSEAKEMVVKKYNLKYKEKEKVSAREVPTVIQYEEREIELDVKQIAEFQKLFEERKKENMEKLKSMDEYLEMSKEFQLQSEKDIESKSMDEAKDLLIKIYRSEFRQQPKVEVPREYKSIKRRFKIGQEKD